MAPTRTSDDPFDIELIDKIHTHGNKKAKPAAHDSMIIHDRKLAEVHAFEPDDLESVKPEVKDGIKVWLFFTKLEGKKRYSHLKGSGKWRNQGIRYVCNSDGKKIGYYRHFTFMKKQEGEEMVKTGWIMKEFGLNQSKRDGPVIYKFYCTRQPQEDGKRHIQSESEEESESEAEAGRRRRRAPAAVEEKEVRSWQIQSESETAAKEDVDVSLGKVVESANLLAQASKKAQQSLKTALLDMRKVFEAVVTTTTAVEAHHRQCSWTGPKHSARKRGLRTGVEAEVSSHATLSAVALEEWEAIHEADASELEEMQFDASKLEEMQSAFFALIRSQGGPPPTGGHLLTLPATPVWVLDLPDEEANLAERCKRRRLDKDALLSSLYIQYPSAISMLMAIQDEVTQGLNLSETELAAITYIRKQIAVNPKENLLSMNGTELNAGQLECLVRPIFEDRQSKWLCTGIMSSYVSMFNSKWDKDTENENKNKKHAIPAETGQWLQETVAEEWRKPGLPYDHSHQLFRQFVEADMIFIPINPTNSHWWLCVLYPAIKEIQVLDSFDRTLNYEQETKKLIRRINLILQGGMSSLEKFRPRWSNYDILNWSVVVKKNIPRQEDGCSCGIFTIKYMQYWDGSKITNPFSQKDMEKFRKKMPAEMIFSPLNSLTNIKDDVNAI